MLEERYLNPFTDFGFLSRCMESFSFLPVSTGSVLKNQASQHPIWDLVMAWGFSMRKETLPITSLLVVQCCYVVLWRRHSFF